MTIAVRRKWGGKGCLGCVSIEIVGNRKGGSGDNKSESEVAASVLPVAKTDGGD